MATPTTEQLAVIAKYEQLMKLTQPEPLTPAPAPPPIAGGWVQLDWAGSKGAPELKASGVPAHAHTARIVYANGKAQEFDMSSSEDAEWSIKPSETDDVVVFVVIDGEQQLIAALPGVLKKRF